MMQSFRPELLNRVDEKIIFKPLGSEELKAIARWGKCEFSFYKSPEVVLLTLQTGGAPAHFSKVRSFAVR